MKKLLFVIATILCARSAVFAGTHIQQGDAIDMSTATADNITVSTLTVTSSFTINASTFSFNETVVDFSSTVYLNKSPGTSGQVLTSAGDGAVPTWTTPTGASDPQVDPSTGIIAGTMSDDVILGYNVDASTGLANVNAGTDLTADLEEETHASEHENGGADAISVNQLSGQLADPQRIEITTGTTVISTGTLIEFRAGANMTITSNQGTSSATVVLAASGGGSSSVQKMWWAPKEYNAMSPGPQLETNSALGSSGLTGVTALTPRLRFDSTSDEGITLEGRLRSDYNGNAVVTLTHASVGSSTNTVTWLTAIKCWDPSSAVRPDLQSWSAITVTNINHPGYTEWIDVVATPSFTACSAGNEFALAIIRDADASEAGATDDCLIDAGITHVKLTYDTQ